MDPHPLPPPPIASRPLGAILMDQGRLSPEDTEIILTHQQEAGLAFGATAIQLGLLSAADIQFALARQFDYAYLPLLGDKPVGEELLAAYRPFCQEVENLRALRSQLLLRWFDKKAGRRALALVGAGSGEGRSFVAANLAIVFSQLGERTLLIDADLRSPRQHKLFKQENRMGFSSLLGGLATGDPIVPIAALSNLFLLPAGPLPPNPLELLNRPSFTQLLRTVASAYDIILIDTPAAAHFADTSIIASRVGAALLVARCNDTQVTAFSHLARTLASAGVAVVGSVFNAPPAPDHHP